MNFAEEIKNLNKHIMVHEKIQDDQQQRLERYRQAIKEFLSANGGFNISTSVNACTEDRKTCNQTDGADCVLNTQPCLFNPDKEIKPIVLKETMVN